MLPAFGLRMVVGSARGIVARRQRAERARRACHDAGVSVAGGSR
jgi:hypothetical protein